MSGAPTAPSTSSIEALYTDNCGSVMVNQIGSSVTGTNCSWTATYTYSITDACGNAASNAVVTYTGGDTEAPTLVGTLPGGPVGNVCMSAPPTAPSTSSIAAVYTDNCSAATATLIGSSVTGDNCSWTATYTYSIVDACGNAAPNAVVTYTGGDTEAPTLVGTLPGGPVGNVCMSAPPTAPSTSSIAAVYTDNCSAATATLIRSSVTGDNCSWTATYTYSIADACGNAASNAVVTYTGGDTEAPTLVGTLPGSAVGNVCMSAAPTAPSTSSIAALYTDNCSAATATLIGSSVTGTNCSWTAMYTYSIADACGNAVSNAVVTYTGGDTEAPVIASNAVARSFTGCSVSDISGPAYSAVSASSTYSEFSDANNQGVASDNCASGNNLVVTYQDVITNVSCPVIVSRTWSIADECGHATTSSQLLTITAQAVSINNPGDLFMPACQTQQTIDAAYTAWLNASFNGGCNGVITNNSTGAPSANGGSVTVTWTVTSDCESPVTSSSTFTVTDRVMISASITTPIHCKAGTGVITVTATGGTGIYTGTGNFTVTAGTYTMTVADNQGCSSSTTITVSEPALITGTTTEHACDTYTWTEGSTYTVSGVRTHTFVAANGCDSIHTLNLTVGYTSYNTISRVDTVSYTWPVTGLTYSLSGTYLGTYHSNATGCDSVITLNLTIYGIRVRAKVFLDGPYNSTTGLMNDSLRIKNLIPTSEPFTSMIGFPALFEANGETISQGVLNVTGNNAIVDWVYLELRTSAPSYSKVATRRGLVQRDGDIVDMDGVTPVTFRKFLPGSSYFVSVKHRNHLGVMTSNAIPLTLAGAVLVDFTDTVATSLYKKVTVPASLMVNKPTKQYGAVSTLWSGDAKTNKNTKYNGLSNDKDLVLAALPNGDVNATIHNVYRAEDVNLDGMIRFNNTNNDRAVILGTVGVSTPNNIFNQHTPD
jgi:hypothetical protein